MVTDTLPAGTFRLVDNRIMLGDSTWAVSQPIVIATLHHKQCTDEQRVLIQQMLAELNAARAILHAMKTPAGSSV